MWTYSQSYGALTNDGRYVGTGYSGFGAGKNNPEMQGVHDAGPIPRGTWEIGSPGDSAAHGPHVMALKPLPGTVTHSRAGFLIHGDSIEHPGQSSHGCIILARSLREKIAASGDRLLQVV